MSKVSRGPDVFASFFLSSRNPSVSGAVARPSWPCVATGGTPVPPGAPETEGLLLPCPRGCSEIDGRHPDRQPYRRRIAAWSFPFRSRPPTRAKASTWSAQSKASSRTPVVGQPYPTIGHEVIAGAVGTGVATEFSALLRMSKETPNLAAILPRVAQTLVCMSAPQLPRCDLSQLHLKQSGP